MSKLEHFMGGSPLRVVLKLIFVSLIVGVVMAAFNWTPLALFEDLLQFVKDIWSLGFEALGRLGRYLVLGASVVIPIFILARIFRR